jgi:hypothetical protein
MVEISNRLCRPIASFICNFNKIKFIVCKERCYRCWVRVGFEKSRSMGVCELTRKQIGHICWSWWWTSIRWSKAKNCNCKSNLKRSQNITLRLSNFSLR